MGYFFLGLSPFVRLLRVHAASFRRSPGLKRRFALSVMLGSHNGAAADGWRSSREKDHSFALRGILLLFTPSSLRRNGPSQQCG